MFERNDRLKELFKAELMTALRSVKDPGITGFMTVTDLEISPDRKIVMVFYSIMGSAEQRQSTAKALERSSLFIRKLMRKRLALKVIPQFVFSFDETPLKASRIDKLLDQIREEGK